MPGDDSWAGLLPKKPWFDVPEGYIKSVVPTKPKPAPVVVAAAAAEPTPSELRQRIVEQKEREAAGEDGKKKRKRNKKKKVKVAEGDEEDEEERKEAAKGAGATAASASAPAAKRTAAAKPAESNAIFPKQQPTRAEARAHMRSVQQGKPHPLSRDEAAPEAQGSGSQLRIVCAVLVGISALVTLYVFTQKGGAL